MRKTALIFGAVFVIGWLTRPASPQTRELAADERGSWLYAACQADIRAMDSSTGGDRADLAPAERCQNYIKGFVDGAPTTMFCVEGASIGTVARVYVAQMQKYPKLMDEYRAIGMLSALAENYPCSKN